MKGWLLGLAALAVLAGPALAAPKAPVRPT